MCCEIFDKFLTTLYLCIFILVDDGSRSRLELETCTK